MPTPPTILIAQSPVLIFGQIHHLARIRINLPARIAISIHLQSVSSSFLLLLLLLLRSLAARNTLSSRGSLL
jgi:hypothetical protein